MKVLLSPQRKDDKIIYSFDNEIITATYKGITDTFNLSILQEGQQLDTSTIQTKLEVNPIVSAERSNGVISVRLLNFIGENATNQEKFPVWQET